MLGRKIALLGVGALGSMLTKALAKCDPAEFLLIDRGRIEPGNLVRHEADATCVEAYKAESLATILARSTHRRSSGRWRWTSLGTGTNSLQSLRTVMSSSDATGDVGVHAQLTDDAHLIHTHLAWCYVKSGPRFGLLALRRPDSPLTLRVAQEALQAALPTDVWAQFEAMNASNANNENEQDDSGDNGLLWPTPGCYHPTFEAAYHGMRLMADEMLTVFLDWLPDGSSSDVVTLFAQERRPNRFGVDQYIVEQVRLLS